jgi:hypothetical protein
VQVKRFSVQDLKNNPKKRMGYANIQGWLNFKYSFYIIFLSWVLLYVIKI